MAIHFEEVREWNAVEKHCTLDLRFNKEKISPAYWRMKETSRSSWRGHSRDVYRLGGLPCEMAVWVESENELSSSWSGDFFPHSGWQSRLNSVGKFINILQAAFAQIFFCQKITKQNYNLKKAAQSTFVPKTHTENVDEIDTGRQFQISNPNHSFVIFGAKILCKKRAHKMLM